jgi:two-component sensor histidine kinase
MGSVEVVDPIERDRMQPQADDQFRADKDLLVRELTHRINNEYSATIGLLSLAVTRSKNAEVRQELSSVLNSLHCYARVHRALGMPSCDNTINAARYVRDLCSAITKSRLESRGIELVLVEHEFEMNAVKCWRMGMILSELITNSSRHAFDHRVGTIQIDLSQVGSVVECRVTDNGSAQVDSQPGRGLKLVDELAKSLRGEAIHQFGPSGTTTLIVFPRDD